MLVLYYQMLYIRNLLVHARLPVLLVLSYYPEHRSEVGGVSGARSQYPDSSSKGFLEELEFG